MDEREQTISETEQPLEVWVTPQAFTLNSTEAESGPPGGPGDGGGSSNFSL